MRVIFNECLCPYFNLASEEYLLESFMGDAFMIWRNEKSVIIGKNQNAYGEIDQGFCEEKGIKIVRRLTGGGAVFHDPGNINFSFVTDAAEEGINFLPYVESICKALSRFGIKAAANGRNDIEVNGLKISGNAQCIRNCRDGRRRLLHHGTLLFSADMSALEGALRVDGEKMESKGIKSVRNRVVNIRDIGGYTGPRSPLCFARELCKCFEADMSDFTAEEKAEIEGLAREKYSKWEWNYGESPRFSVEKSKRFPFGSVEIAYTAKKGTIEDIKITGDFFAAGDIEELETGLIGTTLEKEDLEKAFESVHKYIHGATGEEIAELLLKNK
ncbi:MAG: lipoate--protein ligase [Clostridia bacterium]|nr:lipoate--protein ligase [Clostridia bacterium]